MDKKYSTYVRFLAHTQEHARAEKNLHKAVTSSTHKKENQKDVGIFQHRKVFENRSVQDMQNCVNVTSLAPFQAAELLLNTPFLTISEQGATLKNDRKTWSFRIPNA